MRSAPLPLAGYSASVLGVGDASRALGFLRVFPRPVKTGQRAQLALGTCCTPTKAWKCFYQESTKTGYKGQ